MSWTIYKYKCDSNGVPYGDLVTSTCYSQELMDSYKNRKFVDRIVENHSHKVVWERSSESRQIWAPKV